MLVLHEKVAALNILHYILSHNYDYRSILLVIFSKATMSTYTSTATKVSIVHYKSSIANTIKVKVLSVYIP